MYDNKKASTVKTTDSYGNVRLAIIQQAIEDYRRALRKNDYRDIKALERWFLSEWGEMLSGDNGAYIIEKVKNQERGKNNE